MITFDEQIQKDFDDVIKYSQDYLFMDNDKINTTPIFDLWKANKYGIYKLFGNKLIVETDVPVEFKLTEDKSKKELHRFLDSLRYNFNVESLIKFISSQPLEAVFSNRVGTGYECLETKVPKGMKLSKAFKYFVEDEGQLRVIQDVFSEMVQKNKVCGKLCISIHPLDYLSTSETTHNWRSCHALDGEYRAGGLAYMCDKTTVVCYIKSDEDAILPRFPKHIKWNDKKWRMLLHMEEAGQRLMIAGRQYPMEIDGARDLVKDMINRLKVECYNYTPPFNDHSFVAWNDEHFNSFTSSDLSNPEEVKYTTKPYRYINGLISAMSTFVKTPKSQTLHYNDVLLSHVYPYPHITWETNRSFGIVPKVHIGYDGVPCVCCGEEPICNSETFACRSCNCADDSYCCDYCGSSVDEDEVMYVEFDDSYICPRCFHEHYLTCVNCGYVMPRQDAIFNTELGDFVCQDCNSEANEALSNATQNSTPAEEQTIHQAVRAIPIDNQPGDVPFDITPDSVQQLTIDIGEMVNERIVDLLSQMPLTTTLNSYRF